MARVEIRIEPRYEGSPTVVTLDTDDPRVAYEYGRTPEQVAHSVAADYCDSGSVSYRVGRERWQLVQSRS